MRLKVHVELNHDTLYLDRKMQFQRGLSTCLSTIEHFGLIIWEAPVL